jgi:hypothetical protein
VALLAPGSVRLAYGQGQEMPPIKVDLPPPPNFNITTAPAKYPTGELSIYGLRKHMSQYLDKDVQVKAYLLQIYECPAEQRKCNDDLAVKSKKEKKKELSNLKKGKETAAAPAKGGAPAPMAGGCRPCDQPHFYLGDTATTKLDHGLLVADYPIKDWNTGKPKPLVAKAGDQYIVTGTFAINSIGGFAASDGLIIHKKFTDAAGKVIAEGNAVLPPDITARISVEMGSTIGWDRYVLPGGTAIGMHSFGASAPIKDLMAKFGFTSDQVLVVAKEQIAQFRRQTK